MNTKQIIILTTILALLMCSTASAWLSGYDHRVEVPVNNTGDALTYYQYNFTMDTATEIAVGNMTYADGRDCQMTDVSDNLLSLWNATPFNTSDTKIWVNATSLGNVSNTTHYMYYGKTVTSSNIDGDATFYFYNHAGENETVSSYRQMQIAGNAAKGQYEWCPLDYPVGVHGLLHNAFAINISSQNKTFFTYQGAESDWTNEGDPYITYFDHVTKTFATSVRIGNNPTWDRTNPKDEHGYPAMWINSTGYIHVIWGGHGEDIPHSVSDSPYSISSFTALPNFGTGACGSYPQVWRKDNTIYVFRRITDGNWVMRNSTDGGYSWGSDITIVSGSGTYWFGVKKNDRINFFGMETTNRRIAYYFYYNISANTYHKVDDTSISIPFAVSSANKIYEASSGRIHLMQGGADVDASNVPYATIEITSATSGYLDTECTYDAVMWNGTGWESNTISNLTTWSYGDSRLLNVKSSSDIDLYTVMATQSDELGSLCKYNSVDGLNYTFVERITDYGSRMRSISPVENEFGECTWESTPEMMLVSDQGYDTHNTHVGAWGTAIPVETVEVGWQGDISKMTSNNTYVGKVCLKLNDNDATTSSISVATTFPTDFAIDWQVATDNVGYSSSGGGKGEDWNCVLSSAGATNMRYYDTRTNYTVFSHSNSVATWYPMTLTALGVGAVVDAYVSNTNYVSGGNLISTPSNILVAGVGSSATGNTYLSDLRVRKYASPAPIASVGAVEDAPIAELIITLLSQTPAILYQNSTGYMNISYGITHDSSGLNNTSVSFIFRNYDHTLNDANHSIRPPANDKCEMWNFDGQIMRAANRNETLNFENNDTITGGDIFTWSGLDENNTRLTIAPVNSTYTIVHINGTIHDLAMEQMWYLDRTDMVESPKTQLSIHKSQDVLIKFWNAEIFKGNYDFIGIGYTDTSLKSAPSLKPSDANPVSFYYLNSSYDPLGGVDPLDSGYAVFMGSLNGTQWVDHVYSPNQNASYVRGAINNTLLNSVIDTTGISYLYFKSETPSSKPYYINITDSSTNTNRTFGQNDVLWIGDTAPYTAHPYTPNAWFAFVYESTSFDHKLYVADNNDKWGNSTLQSTNIGAGLFPPTTPTIHHFNFNGSTDYDKNKTYSGIIDVGIGVGTDPDGGTVTHNLTLQYANKTFVAIINNTFTDAGIIGNGVYSNISFNTTPYYSETEEYTMKVVATDDEGETSESWSCCNFTLGTHQISNLHTTTLVHDRIVWGWTNPDHYDTIMVYLDNTWKQNTTGTSYSASGLNQGTAYTIKLITVYAGEESDPVTDTQVTTTEQGGSGGGGGVIPTPTPTPTPIPTPTPRENITENVSIAIEPIPDITEEITSNYTVTGSIWHLSFDKHAVFLPEYRNIIACDAMPPYACRYYEDQKKFEIVIDGESPEPVFKADQWVTFITRDGKRISQRIDTKVYNPLFYFTMPAISGSVGDFSRYFIHGDEYMVDGIRFWWIGMFGIGLIAWRWKKK